MSVQNSTRYVTAIHRCHLIVTPSATTGMFEVLSSPPPFLEI
jgi:hypothetical protein